MSETEARVVEAIFSVLETDEGMEWVALQNGRLELRGSVSKDALVRAIIDATRPSREASRLRSGEERWGLG